jgi:ergothioneine biosynthesis protein EgtB
MPPATSAVSRIKPAQPAPVLPSITPARAAPREDWLVAYRTVRAETERRAASLSPEDQVVQSMADASPIKWHRAHTTWFFETFLLKPFVSGCRGYDDRFPFLFNSYYVAAGPRHERPKRGLITRPDAAEVGAYRVHVDDAVERLIDRAGADDWTKIVEVLELGLHHEQQHQELMLTDILHAFAQNPTAPAYDPNWQPPRTTAAKGFAEVSGVETIGFDGSGFSFDNEHPAHRVFLEPVRVARGLVTNGEWLEFMADGGYEKPALWLSDGFATAQNEGWQAPLYWREVDGAWYSMTLGGLRPVDPAAPVCHVSYYEADAFARVAGKHLPSEAEWEVAARGGELADAYGVLWQWTRSAYAPYPGYRAIEGALGEYNGKFMVNQLVLRGSSLATPEGHTRPSYRNFFYPAHRWQFTGLRLAAFN